MVNDIKPCKSSDLWINIFYLLFVLTLPVTTLQSFKFYAVSVYLFCLTCVFSIIYIMVSIGVVYFFSEISHFLAIIPLAFFAFGGYYFLNKFASIIRIIFRRVANIKISVIISEYKYGYLYVYRKL